METKERLYDMLSEAYCIMDDMKQQRVRLEAEIDRLHEELRLLTQSYTDLSHGAG